MPTYKITAVYKYDGEVEAPTPERAEQLFLAEINMHYDDTLEFECVELEECPECGEAKEDATAWGGICHDCDNQQDQSVDE